jgi:single-strand DNA-binding protein
MFNVTVSGNLVADPRAGSAGGSDVTSFSIISNTRKGGEDIASLIDCSVWGKRSEVAAKYLKKGNKVTVSGSAHLDTYEGKSGTVAKLVLNVGDFDLPAKPKDEEPF